MKDLKFWLMSLAILCSCTNSIEESVSEDLMTKSMNKPVVTITFDFNVQRSNTQPVVGYTTTQGYCSIDQEVGISSIMVPTYNAWCWSDNNWNLYYYADYFTFVGEGYSDNIPLVMTDYTAIWKDKIEITPSYLKDLYDFEFESTGISIVNYEPSPMDNAIIPINPPTTPEWPYDSLASIKKPIIIVDM